MNYRQRAYNQIIIGKRDNHKAWLNWDYPYYTGMAEGKADYKTVTQLHTITGQLQRQYLRRLGNAIRQEHRAREPMTGCLCAYYEQHNGPCHGPHCNCH